MAQLSTLALVYLAIHMLATWGGRIASILRRRLPGATKLPKEGVTCLKPLCGIDVDLVENLESYAALLTTQPLEILLIIEQEDDKARPVAEAFAAKHPNLVRIIYGHAPDCGNAKVAALMRAAPEARHPLLWITDSNIRVTQGHFESMLAAWQQKQAKGRIPTLVYAPISADGDNSLGTRCERLHQTTHINWCREVARLGGSQAMVGKSYLIHRDDLPTIGGYEPYKDAAGDDYLMARAMNRVGAVGYARFAPTFWFGRKHKLENFLKRQLRWSRVRAHQIPLVYYGVEHFTYAVFPVLLSLAGLIPWYCVAGILAGQMLLDQGMLRVHVGRWCFGDVLLYPLKELLVCCIYLRGMWRGRIVWRGRALGVNPGGKLVAK